MKIPRSLGFLALSALVLAACQGPREPAPDARVAFAGLRCSTYGIKPFPAPAEWDRYAAAMEGRYPGSVGAFVWIVGYVNGQNGERTCTINFPLAQDIKGVEDFPLDENEAFLKLCDQKGWAVWLQVEPGSCDLPALATATMERYRQHPSVRGFGVDVEWWGPGGTDGWGIPVTDALARGLDTRVKAVSPRYSVFLKHWDTRWMPPTFRSDLIFVNDSQGHESLDTMKRDFAQWSAAYYPNPVMFQIGYEADRGLWETLKDPPRDLGNFLAEALPRDQKVGIVWVDFTLRSVLGAETASR